MQTRYPHYAFGIFALALAALASPAVAQTANFGRVTLSSASLQSASPLQGYTQGSVPLASMVLEDHSGNLCVGFAESAPDHVLVAEQNLGPVTLRVNSGGGDTTLLVRRSDGTTWCGDDAGNSADATVRLNNMRADTYQVWVGSFDSGVRYDYTLSVQ